MARRNATPAVWPWILTAATIGAGIYLILGGRQSGGAPDPATAATPTGTAGAERAAVSLTPIVPIDTAVAPGASVQLAVRAVLESGQPLSSVAVHFAVEGRSGGSLLTEETWTDGDGVAGTALIMPAHPAEVVVLADLVGADGVATRFTILGRRITRERMEYLEGDGQEADPGALLPRPYVVEVTGADGRPKSGIVVRFQVVSGGGRAEPESARSDALGRASTRWRLGPAAGFQSMAATSDVVETPVTFTAIAGALPPSTRAGASTTRAPVSEVEPDPFASQQPPEALRPVTVVEHAFAVGGSGVCAVRATRVTCRGADDRGQMVAGGLAGVRAVATGLFHACALDPSGTARCWGANEAGQLGDGTRTDRATPTLVATELRFSMLSAGVSHTCGLTNGGRVACWGGNLGGQLGDGSRDDRTTPAPGAAPSFVVIEAGWNHTCGVTASGAAFCWGLNRDGQVGDGSTLDRLVPRQVTTSVQTLAAGGSHTCAIAELRVLCWGDNGTGQLGDGTTDSRPRPAPVGDLLGVPTALATGAAHTCALVVDGTAYCWGQNTHGQLGDGTTTNSTRPVRVAGDIIFDQLRAGGAVTCGMTAAGQEYCWGLNQSGQLGDGTLTSRSVPTAVVRG